MTITIPTGAQNIISALQSNNYEAYIVGGCVRDSILGRTPHDWDICTNATPEQVKSCLCSYRTVDTGIKHGTLTVLAHDGSYEVTTYRIDGQYSDHRHPDSIHYTPNLIEDLSRRDFTINAMAYNSEVGLIDPFGGREDLPLHVIRCVGQPLQRFGEDHLRILRALRFASQFEFSIDPHTAAGIQQLKEKLDGVARERVFAEVCKLIDGPGVLEVLLRFAEVISVVIPELQPCINFPQNNSFHCYNVYDHIAHTVENCHSSDLIVKLAALFHDVGKPSCRTTDERGDRFYGHAPVSADMADAALLRLKADNETRRSVVELIRYHDAVLLPTKSAIRKWIGKIGVDQFKRLIALHRADVLAHTPGVLDAVLKRLVEVEMVLDEVLSEPPMFSVKDLAVSGRDILDLGVPQGPVVGVILNYLLERVIAGECENERDCLIGAAEQKVKEMGF